MPPSFQNSESSGVVVLCNAEGLILKVLYDGLGLASQLVPGNSFAEAIAGKVEATKSDAAAAKHFMDTLLQTGYAFGWELPTSTHECVATLRFTGGAADQGVLIVGEPVDSQSSGLIEELMKINNDTVNTLRTAVKQATNAPAVQRSKADQEMELLTELSRANNGAMTAQRELAKKNAALLEANTALERAGIVLAGKQAALEEANLRLDALATLDGLTGVRNRRAFEDILYREVARSVRYGSPLSLILLDVDKFKEYNDSYGHQAGDDVLRGVGRILQEQARTTDFVARYGGEEFTVILPNTDGEGAVVMAERLRRAIATAPWPERPITASFGAATFNTATNSVTTLVAAADRALYVSKEKGRNTVTHTQYLSASGNERRE